MNSTKRCIECGNIKPLKEFAANNFINDGTNVDIICKKCRRKLVVDEESLKSYLKANKRPYNKSLFDECLKKTEENLRKRYKNDEEKVFNNLIKTTISNYFRIIALDNIEKEKREDKNTDYIYSSDDIDFEVTPKMIKFWGEGFTKGDYMFLEDYYNELIAFYEHNTPIQKSIYKNMAITQLEANKAIKEGKRSDYEKLMRSLSNLMNDANIKPVQESGEHDGLSTFGEWVKKIEETEPIPEPSEEFKDVDNIRKYINKWFVGHMKKIFGINQDIGGSDN